VKLKRPLPIEETNAVTSEHPALKSRAWQAASTRSRSAVRRACEVAVALIG
jgi:hypothetical protein